MAKPMIGFDIGTASLKLAVVTKKGIERLAVETLPENLVRDGTIVSYEAMANFIKDAAQRNRIRGGDCAIVLPVGVSFLRQLLMPIMTVDQLEFNLPYEFRDYVEQSKEAFYYDYAMLSMMEGTDDQQGEMEILGAAVPKQAIENYRMMFHRAGFTLQIAAPAECAFSNLLRMYIARQEQAEECCIIDVGHTATRMYFYTGSRFETNRVIDTGAVDFDRAIAEARNIDEHVARSHKETKYEGTFELDEVRDVCEAIAVEVMKAINFYGLNNRNSNLENAYICGGGAYIADLVEAVRRASGLNVQGIDSLLPEKIEIGAENMEMCATAIGISMQ